MLRCDQVSKSFDGVHALQGVSLSFPVSDIAAIIGPNGAGKTTLINVLTGFLRPNAGRCFLDDRDTTDFPPYKIARMGLARTFQDLRLIRQVSVMENVMMAHPNQRGEKLRYALTRIRVAREEEACRERSMDLLRFVGLVDASSAMAGELSYGQQKLLSLACCLATNARVLLLDEPVAGVAPEMVSRLLELLKRLKNDGKSIIFIEHNIEAVREVADTVFVMDHGKLIAAGPPHDVLERPALMDAYLS